MKLLLLLLTHSIALTVGFVAGILYLETYYEDQPLPTDWEER